MKPMLGDKPYEYFVRKVAIKGPSDCWEWKGSTGGPGYGNWCCSVPGFPRQGSAHRRAYALFHGHPGRLQVNHRCGNRRCCNPSHLYAGTQKQNHADAIEHGTHSPPPHVRGERQGSSRLKEHQVVEIKRRFALGERPASIQQDFGVKLSTICKICDGTNWAWVDPC